jgi:glycosyltransferase involved in cell wall biosynthesis
MTFRLAYLVTHPIQYQAPLLRAVARDPDIALKVFFGSDFSAQTFVDPGFGRAIEWDVPLLEGYEHEVLRPRFGTLAPGDLPGFWRPFNRGLATALAAGRFQALWVHGYNRAYHWAAIATARRLGLKILLRDEATDVSSARGPMKQMLKSAFFRLLDRGIDAYLAIGRLNRDYYRGFGIPDAKIFSMPYAVDNEFFRTRIAAAAPEREILRARLGLKPDRPVILFAGKLIARKRPLDLLDAFARISDEPAMRAPYLLFAGDGALKPELERRIAANGLERVTLLGFQSQAELGALYDLADLFVLPSERESWGLVVNEAMNAGRAIIVNDRIGAGADLVIGGENGFIYPVGDVEALATCLRSSLRDPARLTSMGQRSRAIIDRWSFREDVAGLKQALAAVGPGARA